MIYVALGMMSLTAYAGPVHVADDCRCVESEQIVEGVAPREPLVPSHMVFDAERPNAMTGLEVSNEGHLLVVNSVQNQVLMIQERRQ
jgi:hypothetical protein